MPNDWSQYEEKPQSGDRWASFEEAPSKPTQQLTHPPTFMDRISTELNGGGTALDPESIVHGVGNSLGRTTKAWGDMFGGHANPSTLAEMVPLLGPAAVDATNKLFTPGQRLEGATDIGAMLSPFAAHDLPNMGTAPLTLAEGDVPTPGTASRIMSGVKTAAPDIGKGLAKVGTGAALDYAIPGEARIGAVVGTAPMIRSGIGDIGRGFRAGMDEFRGPSFGPEEMPKGFKSPYPTYGYMGDMGSAPPRPAFEPREFSPPTFERESPGNYAGVRLPSGRAVGPSSRANETFQPAPSARIPLWRDLIGNSFPEVSQAPSPAPVRASLPSGRIPGGPTAGGVFSTPSREFISPLESQVIAPDPVRDTVPAYRSRANQSRAKFDANGKRNQLK